MTVELSHTCRSWVTRALTGTTERSAGGELTFGNAFLTQLRRNCDGVLLRLMDVGNIVLVAGWGTHLQPIIDGHFARSRLCAIGLALLSCSISNASFGESADIPDDKTLQDAGAVIGEIVVNGGNVFDTHDPRENNGAYRLANRWHFVTKESVIRHYLLFNSGDAYSRRVLDESARLLRSARFLGDASVQPVRYHDGRVDIEVRTRDVWSLNPGISYGRRGGKDHYGFELQDVNLLGLGVELTLDHDRTVDRVSNSIEWKDAHAFAPHNRLQLRYTNSDDGTSWLASLSRPFYALDTPWAAGIEAEQVDQIEKLYRLGNVEQTYRLQGHDDEVFLGRSSGLHNGWATRWLVGLSRDEQRFSNPASDLNIPLLLPDDRRFIYPWIGVEIVQDEFAIWENHNQIGRTEDIALGARFSAKLGYAASAWGNDLPAWLYEVEVSKGYPLFSQGTLVLESDLTGRWENGTSQDVQANGSARLYLPWSERSLLFGKAELSWGHRLALDHRYLLGGDSGLRGYPLRFQAGSQRALFTLEQRYFTDWYPFRLFRVGAAVFADVGRVWGDDPAESEQYGWLKDIGVGLRLGNTRSSLGNVIHIDLAMPLDRTANIDRLQFVVEARREF